MLEMRVLEMRFCKREVLKSKEEKLIQLGKRGKSQGKLEEVTPELIFKSHLTT